MIPLRLQCVNLFYREILQWVWDILWSVKSFVFLLGHCEAICEFLYFHLCAVSHGHGPTMVESMPILVWDLQCWALLWRPYRSCKMLSILTSSGEKLCFTGLPKPGILHCKMPVPFLCCGLIYTWGKQQDCPTPHFPRWTLLRWKCVHSASFSQGGLLD